MGTYFQTFVVEDIPDVDVERLVKEIIGWLAGRSIIEEVLAGCVLDGDELGYPPGPNYRLVLETIVANDLLDLAVNGLQIDRGRKVYPPGQGETKLFCPNCGHPSNFDESWDRAIIAWCNEGKSGDLLCTECKQIQSVTKWVYRPSWGFGNLGFTFWNWSVFREDFISEFSSRCTYRTVFLAGKL